MQYKKNCVICGKAFETFNHTKSVCPGECRTKANTIYAREFMRKKRKEEKVIVKKICISCHSEFKTLKISDRVICLPCELYKKNLPQVIKEYDKSNIDHDGIIYTQTLPISEEKPL